MKTRTVALVGAPCAGLSAMVSTSAGADGGCVCLADSLPQRQRQPSRWRRDRPGSGPSCVRSRGCATMRHPRSSGPIAAGEARNGRARDERRPPLRRPRAGGRLDAGRQRSRHGGSSRAVGDETRWSRDDSGLTSLEWPQASSGSKARVQCMHSWLAALGTRFGRAVGRGCGVSLALTSGYGACVSTSTAWPRKVTVVNRPRSGATAPSVSHTNCT